MNDLLIQQLDELLANCRIPTTELQCETALRIGAATLHRAAPNEITATTVVCDLHDGEVEAVECLVRAIADRYGLEAGIQWQAGCCSVRFTSPPPSGVPKQPPPPKQPLLARLLRRSGG